MSSVRARAAVRIIAVVVMTLLAVTLFAYGAVSGLGGTLARADDQPMTPEERDRLVDQLAEPLRPTLQEQLEGRGIERAVAAGIVADVMFAYKGCISDQIIKGNKDGAVGACAAVAAQHPGMTNPKKYAQDTGRLPPDEPSQESTGATTGTTAGLAPPNPAGYPSAEACMNDLVIQKNYPFDVAQGICAGAVAAAPPPPADTTEAGGCGILAAILEADGVNKQNLDEYVAWVHSYPGFAGDAGTISACYPVLSALLPPAPPSSGPETGAPPSGGPGPSAEAPPSDAGAVEESEEDDNENEEEHEDNENRDEKEKDRDHEQPSPPECPGGT